MKTKLTLATNNKGAFIIKDIYGDRKEWELKPCKPAIKGDKKPTLEETKELAGRIVNVFQALQIISN